MIKYFTTQWWQGKKTYTLYIIGVLAFFAAFWGFISIEVAETIWKLLGLTLPLTIYAAIKRNK